MSNYKTNQRFVAHRGRTFHFVSYEGQVANQARSQEAMPPTWFLMGAGKRFAVMPQDLGDADTDVDTQLVRWLDEHIFGSADEPVAATLPPAPRRHQASQEPEASPARTFATKRHYR